MDVHQTPVNPYHPSQHHIQHPHNPHQPIQQQNVPVFNPNFAQFPPQQYYAQPQQGPQRGLSNASYATSSAPNYHTAPSSNNNNALRYPPHQFSLPVHNALPIQRRAPPPQHPPQPQLPQAAAQVPPPQQLVQPDVGSTSQAGGGNVSVGKVDKHLKGLRCILEPPEKELWRQRLFDVDGLMILTEEQYARPIHTNAHAGY
jgi:hypothetical protein